MADTAAPVIEGLERPIVTPGEKLHPNWIDFDAPIPDAADIDLSTFDIVNPELWRRNAHWDFFARMRKEDPVHWCPDSFFGPYWSITKYNDIMAIDTNHEVFSSSWEHGGIVLGDQVEEFELPMFIAMDPPKHDVQRKTVQPIVSPTNLRNVEPLIRERTQKVLDSLPVGEPFDFVDKVSIELTGMMLATLFGVPQEDRRKLTHWSDIATNRDNPDICPGGLEQWKAELMECLAYFTEMWNERVNSEPTGDLISMLAHGKDTKNMEPMEYLGNIILLIVGGNDTTRNSMTGGLLALNENPAEYDKLRSDPSVIPNMISEIIRWQTPLAFMRRTALEDFKLRDKTIKKGDQVAMWYVSGNRDEDVIDRADEFLIDRPMARRHLSFGFGIHRCVGNRLGEMQLRILWEEILERWDRIEVLDEPSRTPSAFVKGYTWMPVIIRE